MNYESENLDNVNYDPTGKETGQTVLSAPTTRQFVMGVVVKRPFWAVVEMFSRLEVVSSKKVRCDPVVQELLDLDDSRLTNLPRQLHHLYPY